MVAGESGAEGMVAGSRARTMASAVVAAIVLSHLDARRSAAWTELALIVGDPGKIDRRTAALRALSIGLVLVLILGALWATALPDLRAGSSQRAMRRSRIRATS